MTSLDRQGANCLAHLGTRDRNHSEGHLLHAQSERHSYVLLDCVARLVRIQTNAGVLEVELRQDAKCH